MTISNPPREAAESESHMLNSIPVLGWALALFFNVSLAIPFYICWNWFGIGKTYFYFLPPVYLDIGFWATVGVFTVLSILKRFVPVFASSSASAEAEKKPTK